MLWTNTANFNELNVWVKKLDAKMKEAGENKLRVFIVFTNPQKQKAGVLEKNLNNWLATLKLEKVAVVYVPSVDDVKSNASKYNINPNVNNTLFVYRKRREIDKYINPQLDNATLENILQKFDYM